MLLSISPFGNFNDQNVELFTLKNTSGMTVKITNYGATITSLQVPDKNGVSEDIVCGFDSLEGYFSEEYKNNSPYFGCTVGRYAARIKDGKFSLNDKDFQVACNDGPNHLHGGVEGFDKILWEAEPFTDQKTQVGVRLSLVSPENHEAYPGELKVSVTYTLTNENELKIDYEANCDADTPLSLTNHTYFNLGAFENQIIDHQVQIKSNSYLQPDESNVPCGKLSALCEATNFLEAKTIGDSFAALPQGFEHYYIFEDTSSELKTVANFSHPGSGRKLEVQSTEPGMLFYTGYYTSDNLRRNDEVQFGQFRGFCCETSKYPNGPNIEGSPRSILKAGETYSETTQFKFSTEKN